MDDRSKYTQGGYEKFRKAVFAMSKPVLDKRFNENRNEWIVITKNILFNQKGQKTFSKPPTKEEEIILKIRGGFNEIALSYDSMTEIPLYLKKYPQKLIWKSKFLEFVIVNYLNEVYILSERLEAYTKKIIRLSKKHPDIAKVEKEILTFDKLFKDLFNSHNNNLRGEHVHVRRFEDDDLNRLVYLEVLYHNGNNPNDKFVNSEYKKAIAFNKKKWLDSFEESNKKYERFLDMYFTMIYSIVFDKHGTFRNPK